MCNSKKIMFLQNIMPGYYLYSPLRRVSTWTPLAATFNRKPQRKLSLAFNRNQNGLFGNPLLVTPKGFDTLRTQAENEAERLVKEATDAGRTRNIVGIFDELSDCLCKVADLAECIRILHSDQDFVMAAERAHSSVNGLVEELNTNRPLYNTLKKSFEHGDVKSMDAVDRHVAKLFLVDFEHCGIHLDLEKRRQVVELNAGILAAGSTFMRRCHEPRYVKSSAFPKEIYPYFQKQYDQIIVNHQMSDFPLEMVREAAYKVYHMPDQYQAEPLHDLLNKRYKLARLVGFKSYSERANRGSIFESPELIRNFLETLADGFRPLAEKEYSQLLNIKRQIDSSATQVYPWDTSFLISLARQEKTDLDTTDLAPYFPLGTCIEGLNQLFGTLYGVHFIIEDIDSEDSWSSDVYKMSVRTKDETILGYIYCDFYERKQKTAQDCHFTIRCGRELPDSSYQIPIVVLSLNLSPPSGSTPCLLNLWQIDNLFHEMGHAMHSMLGRTKYQHVTGTRCSTDFAEVPSTLMEYFASDSRVLSRISRHYQTGESLPENTLKTVLESRKSFSATESQLQIFYAVLDQVIHGNEAVVDTTKTFGELHAQYVTMKHVPNTAWHLRFGHLFGYGARYYSYLLARSVASDIWKRHFEKDPFSKEGGHHLRYDMLCHGGGRPPLELVSRVLGHSPSIDEIVRAIVDMTKAPR